MRATVLRGGEPTMRETADRCFVYESVIGLDGAEALEAVRNAQGPARIVVAPNGTGTR